MPGMTWLVATVGDEDAEGVCFVRTGGRLWSLCCLMLCMAALLVVLELRVNVVPTRVGPVCVFHVCFLCISSPW
jgi:hypothetical protein